MVLVGCRREEVKQQEEPNKKNSAMAMGPEKSRSLHNFSLPCLRWGSRRQLRCVKGNGDGGSNNNSGGGDHFSALDRRSPASSSKSSYHHHNESAARLSRKPPLGPERNRRSFADTDSGGKRSTMSRDQNSRLENGRKSSSLHSSTDDNNGIEAMRKKLVLDLQTQMDKMKFAVLNNNYKKKVERIKTPAAPPHSLTPKTNSTAVKTAEEEDEARPWNLRTRRAVCKEPNGSNNSVGGICGGYKELRIDERKPNSMATVGTKSSARRRSDCGVGEYIVGEKRPRPSRQKFSVGLSKQEIEEDFIAIMGTRPPKRPKKRPRAVQKQVDAVYPGLWLTEITADLYKVNENSEARKR